MILTGFLIILIYFWIVFYLSKDFINFFRQQNINFKLAILGSCIFPGLVLLFILNEERFIYYFDFSNYWVKTIQNNEDLTKKGFGIFRKTYESINRDQYNDLASIPVALLSKIFGLDFKYYIFCIYLIYAIPSALLFSNLLIIINRNINRNVLFAPFLILIFVPFLFPLRFGYVDVAGVVIIGLILNLFFKSPFREKVDFKRFIVIGIVLLLLLVTRRWFTFWVISFFLINFILLAIESIYKKRYKLLLFGCLNLGISGFVCAGLMLIFFYGFFELSFLTDYKDIYSAFRKKTWSEHYDGIIRTFGYASVLLFLFGSIGYIKNRLYYEFFYFTLSILFLFFYFVSYNDFTPHHYYLIIPFIAMIIFGNLFMKKKVSIILIGVILAIFSVNFYLNFMSDNMKSSYKIFSTVNGNKVVRSDYKELISIVRDIDQNYEENRKYTYTLTNNHVLNYSIIQNVDLPSKLISTKGLLKSELIDKRDKFPNNLFLANYVLIGDPVQHDMKSSDQQLIVYFNNEFLKGKWQNHYLKTKTYKLINDVKVHRMERVLPFTQREMEEIKNHFKTLYPDYPNMYAVNPTIPYLLNHRRGDGYGDISLEPDGVFMHPGREEKTEIIFNLNHEIKSVKFTASFNNKDWFLHGTCNPDRDGEIFLYISLDNKELEPYYITHKNDNEILLDVSDVKEIKFAVDKGKNEDYCDKFILKNLTFSK